ncbi:hypothetical protein GCM10027447_30630 [Glycomyces halotolerans]
MTPTRTRFLTAAQAATDLLAHPGLDPAWEQPSALEGFTVGGLAAHFAAQITSAQAAIETDPADKPVLGLFDHFAQAAWLGGDIDNDYNTAIRSGGEQAAQAGPETVLDDARAALAFLERALPGQDADAIGGNPRWPYATTLDDFLTTRIMEIVVHADDLAHSLGIPTPVFDADVFDTAMWVLTRLAAARHGQRALIGALARAERAPERICAL